MKTMKTLHYLVSVSAISLVIGLAMPGTASAAPIDFISCAGTGYDISAKVSTATACTILTPLSGNNPNDSLDLVNTKAFFGFADWLFDGKWELPGKSNPSSIDSSDSFNFTGNGQSGTYTYAGLTTISDFMFVFKGGKDTNLVGYRLDGTGTPDDYSTPFTKPPFSFNGNNPKDVSHISVYYRNGGGTAPPLAVPEPGVLLLMGAGLIGLGIARRRKTA